jgi:glycosyltransferase involved in cell wall biosynthesis
MTTQTALAGGLHRIGTSMHATRSYPGFVHWLTTVQPSWHIGLAPLVDTPFNLCKSAIKAMDYAAMGMLVLASDTPVYRGSLADGPAGRLVANSADAWYAAIDLLLRDPDQRRGLAAGARDAWLRAIPARRADTAA